MQIICNETYQFLCLYVSKYFSIALLQSLHEHSGSALKLGTGPARQVIVKRSNKKNLTEPTNPIERA